MIFVWHALTLCFGAEESQKKMMEEYARTGKAPGVQAQVESAGGGSGANAAAAAAEEARLKKQYKHASKMNKGFLDNSTEAELYPADEPSVEGKHPLYNPESSTPPAAAAAQGGRRMDPVAKEKNEMEKLFDDEQKRQTGESESLTSKTRVA